VSATVPSFGYSVSCATVAKPSIYFKQFDVNVIVNLHVKLKG